MSPLTASRPVAQAICGDMLPSQSCSQCSRVHVTVTSAGRDAGLDRSFGPSRSVQPPSGAPASANAITAGPSSSPAALRRSGSAVKNSAAAVTWVPYRHGSHSNRSRAPALHRRRRGRPPDRRRPARAPHRLRARSAGHRPEGLRRPARVAHAPRAPRRRAHRGERSRASSPRCSASARRCTGSPARWPSACARSARSSRSATAGDAARIWREAESGEDLRARLAELPGLRRDEGADGADAARAPVRRAAARHRRAASRPPHARRRAHGRGARLLPGGQARRQGRAARAQPTSPDVQGVPCSTTSRHSTA